MKEYKYDCFIEVWKGLDIYYSRPTSIELLDDILAHTNTKSTLKTIAIFKIKLK